MSILNPKLFAENNRVTRVITKIYLEKYNHLLKWRNHPSILEIGYADGGSSQRSFFPYLPKDMKEFVATDVSENSVEYARKNTTHPLVKVEQLDITAKQVPTQYLNRFDHIFGFFVMHVIQNPTQAFINMHKLLKPGGSIFLSFFEHTPIDDVLEKLGKNPEWNKYGVESLISPYYFSPNPRLEWERNLKETGFQNYQFIEENYSYEFVDEKEFDNLLQAVCCYLPLIPSHKLEEFKQAFEKGTRQGRLIKTEVRDGKKIISFHNFKFFIVSALKT